MQNNHTFSTLLKEPLLHFLLIGAGLFILFSQLNSEEDANNTQQIVIDKSILALLSDNFIKENSRVPTYKEKQILLDKEIEEEILYREALSMGLDKNDRVIRHRLTQKIKYIFEDISMSDDLTNENKDFYESLKSRYHIILNEDIKQELNVSIPN